MPIRNIFWAPGWERDIHLVPGEVSPNLAARALGFTRLNGTTAFAATYLSATPDVTLEFRPLFRGVRNGDFFEGHGLSVDTTTGVVLVSGTQPLPKRNFIIEVTARNTGAGGARFTEVIRMHVHHSVVRLWLTPDRITVRPTGPARPQTTSYRFTARAEFDDGVGDVTLYRFMTWTSTPPGRVSADGRLIITAADNLGDEITIRAALTPDLGAHSATATMRVAREWAAEPNPPKAGIVVGGGWPGTVRPETVPNVLFLGDGFTSAAPDRAAFERMTNSLVTHLKGDRVVRPFDLLATSMNFWRTFVPAAARGISVRSEVYTFTKEGGTVARAMSPAKRPVGDIPWDIEHVMYVVGLPVPADKGKTRDALRAEWATLVDPIPAGKITDDLIDQWKQQAERAYIDELDAFPAMSYGSPPAARQKDYYTLGLHPDRGGLDVLRAFYRVLASENGVELDGERPVGELWAGTHPSFHFNNTDLVVALSSYAAGRAANYIGYIALSTESQNANMSVAAIPGRKAFRLTPRPIRTNVSSRIRRAMAHELAHSFGLGDEYAELARSYQPQADPLPDYANLTTAANARNAAGNFSGDEVKWNWHRIRKAGLIEGAITPAGAQFTLPLRAGHGLQFAPGDKVLLRLRQRRVPLAKLQPQHTLTLAQQLEVATRTRDSITVRPVTAGSVDLAALSRFTPGSIVYLPTPAPSSVRSAAYPYAEMIALNIKNFIAAQNRPLTVVPCANDVANKDQDPIIPGVDLPICFSHKTRIVGLYEGGARHTCDVFHPTGTCMMRQTHAESAAFCAVCRYVLVDFVDPFKHFSIDLDYDEIYPQK